MSTLKNHEILNKLYVEACGNLLAPCGLEVSADNPNDGVVEADQCNYVSVLGATSDQINLCSMLKIDRELLVGLHPTKNSKLLETDLEDWCRELNNQLVGRMKNKLLVHGYEITIGLPVLLQGTAVKAIAIPESVTHEHSFFSLHGQLTLTLTTRVDPDVTIRETSEAVMEQGILLEGEIALF